jgi:hypothetical protein
LDFLVKSVRFVEVNSNYMFRFARQNNRDREFETLVRQLTEGKDWRKRGFDFNLLCSSTKTGRVRLENMLFDTVGMSGDDVLEHLRRRKPLISD